MLAVTPTSPCVVLAVNLNPFPVGVSVGTFTPHHVGREALREAVRVVRPNGLLCLSLRDDFLLDGANGFGDCLAGLVSSGALEPVHVTEPELYTPHLHYTLQGSVG